MPLISNNIHPSCSWSHTISDLRSSSVWKAEASPVSIQNASPPTGRKHRTEELHAALNNFRLSTWKSRQKLASAYPESLKSLGWNFVKLCNKTKMSRKCLKNIFNLHISLRFHNIFVKFKHWERSRAAIKGESIKMKNLSRQKPQEDGVTARLKTVRWSTSGGSLRARYGCKLVNLELIFKL